MVSAMEFKDRIKQLRTDKGFTHTQLASQFDKSEAAVRAWETGRNKPDADTLIELAKYFDCTTDFLLGLSKYKNREHAQKLSGYTSMLDLRTDKLSPEDKDVLFRSLADILDDSDIPADISKAIISDFMIILRCMSLIKDYYKMAEKLFVLGDMNITQVVLSILSSDSSTNSDEENKMLYQTVQQLAMQAHNKFLDFPSFETLSAKYVYNIDKSIRTLVSYLDSSLQKRYNSKPPVPLFSSVQNIGGSKILAIFEDGTQKSYDMEQCLRSEKYRTPQTIEMNDLELMNTIKVESDKHYLSWQGCSGVRSNFAVWNDGVDTKKVGGLNGDSETTEE
jgi:transcriptional regulator with XRE-family HTH domain